MVPSCCWSCLSRLHPAPRALLLPRTTPRITSAPFHSTAKYMFPTGKKKTPTQQHNLPKHRESASMRRKKKKRPVERARPPPVGERKALKKRIVLSNPNALEVEGMQDLSPETMVDSRLRGSVLGLPVSMIDKLRAVHAFQPKQGWSIFRRPGTVLRRETLEMGRLFESISGKSVSGENISGESISGEGKGAAAEGEGAPAEGQSAERGRVVKKIITGLRGSGKTVHLLQAIAMGFLKKWVVITVPDARELVSGDTAYGPLQGTNPTQYVQPNATAALLARTVHANEEVLDGLRVSQQHPELKTLRPSSTLRDLASLGFQSPTVAWPVFQALWKELTATSAAPGMENDFQPRPPMLVAVDGLAHWMTESAYRTANYNPIHAHDLVFVNHFLSLLKQGHSTLPNGGLLLYATSASNNPTIYSFDIALEQLAAHQAGVSPTSPAYPQPAAYSSADARVLDLFKPSENTSDKEGPLELQTLGGLTRDEARGYLEYFARSGLLREAINEHGVSEKWSLSGGGIIGELEKLGRHVRAPAVTVAASP